MMKYKSKEESLLREGCVTAFIDKAYPSNLAYRPQFIPAGNEPSGHAGMSIWRLLRGSLTSNADTSSMRI